jgi:hypothetical protein
VASWTINKEAAGGVFSEAYREIIAFFVDNGLVRSRDHVWLQSAMDILVILFEGIGLRTNPDKTKVMTCVHTSSPHQRGGGTMYNSS